MLVVFTHKVEEKWKDFMLVAFMQKRKREMEGLHHCTNVEEKWKV